MDDEVPIQTNGIDAAASAIEALLKGPGTGEQPKDESPAPTQEAAPAKAEASAERDEEAPKAETSEGPDANAEAPETASEPESKPKEAREPEEVTRKLKEADEAIAQSKAARDQYLNQLNQLVPQLQAAINGEFADIKSDDDLLALADPNSERYSPDRYNRFVLAQAKLQCAQKVHMEALSTQRQDWLKAERTKLHALLPDLADDIKGPPLQQKLLKYAKKEGYSDEEINSANAKSVALLHKAMLADEFTARQAEEAKKLKVAADKAREKSAGAPPVQKPGVARQASGKDEKAQDDFKRLQKSGDVKDAARVFQHILG